ncbi:hypothetical protein [Streptomyces subrutilus]|uniref:hypothetical protein n=1 Tax=Streptomyces subrutilus TaxID=36818 RepID=UPI002E0F7F43|nr:hypothetical protein OG479_31510 [Streptomyces subrutilus]
MRTPHDIGSRLIERKVDVCFAHADRDQDSLIELADVSILFTRILIYLGEPLGSPKALAVHTAAQRFCDHMASVTGWAPDRGTTPEEWREAMAKALAGGAADYDAYFRPVGESVWAAVDRDDDGIVRLSDFAAFQRGMGTPDANIRLAADRMGLRGDTDGLPMADVLRAHREFYTSPDPEAHGNWLYGDVWADAFWDGTRARL